MKTRALMLLATLALAACDKPADEPAKAPAERDAQAAADTPEAKPAADPHAVFTDLSPEKVDAMLAQKGCVPVDANGKDTRAKYGTLPVAVLLSDYKSFDTSELPEDKSTKLVFYCGGQACTAAPKAAKVAKDAGYQDVNVMRAGIRGWVDAGHEVDKPTT
jgi:rhodanese-related sulfurtransferase